MQLVLVGKGDKIRVVRFGSSTGLALARYVKARERHALADSPALWLSRLVTKPLSIHGIQTMLDRRGKLAGWSSTKMPRHYGKAAKTRRALAEHERVAPADSLSAA